ncbi:hypothetical protein [Terriglobus roseus]|uniref:Uncharacterized protein n=1 Tax=Terriglobus roseus TaxID=392734 RepID=A0A1G7MJF1_9BACT|nr:hypothetical protein [Terriglobus roseus]SDF61843.1 hypothetical protein SAMN05444167_2825 [Terriglobus roseus]
MAVFFNRAMRCSGAVAFLLPMSAFSFGCPAVLTTADAKQLAMFTPNARAFHDNLHATLTPAVVEAVGDTVRVRVTARQPGQSVEEVGTYTVHLRTGRVTDEDQEPADDDKTVALSKRLMKRHCP